MAGSRDFVALLAFALMTVVFAGCISSAPADGPEEPEFVDPMAFGEGHDHSDFAQHRLSWRMTELGWTRMTNDALAWAEMDVHPDHDIALVAFAWPTAGFATVDVSDPAAPRLLDIVDLGYGYGADVKWDPSGEWAVLAVQARSQLGLPPSPVPLPVPVPGVDPIAATVESGIRLYHVTGEGVIHDIDSWHPMPTRGVHMLYTHRINDRDYVFAAYNGNGVGVLEIVKHDPPVGARLVAVNAALMWDPMRVPNAPTGAGLSGAHDMTVIDDPILKKPLLYVAHGYDGLFVFDVSDPHDALWPDFPLGSWKDPENTWYMHTVQAEVVDGMRRIVLVPEVFSDAEAEVIAPLWVLDGTDLADMKLLATWRNPGDHGAEMLRFSVHNFQLVSSHVVLAHYHGGVWLLELNATAEGLAVVPVGYHLPANDPGRDMSGIYHGVYNMMDAPSVWDVVVHRGVVWATDVNSGLYAIEAPVWTPGDDVASLG